MPARYYLLSELLAHEGKLNQARTIPQPRRQLDSFALQPPPERFRQFETSWRVTPKPIAARHARRRESPAGGAKSEGGSSCCAADLLGVGAFLLFVRPPPQQPPGYGHISASPDGLPGRSGISGGILELIHQRIRPVASARTLQRGWRTRRRHGRRASCSRKSARAHSSWRQRCAAAGTLRLTISHRRPAVRLSGNCGTTGPTTAARRRFRWRL